MSFQKSMGKKIIHLSHDISVVTDGFSTSSGILVSEAFHFCALVPDRITSMNCEVFSSGLSYHPSNVGCIRHSKLSKSEVPQEILRIITVIGENSITVSLG